MYAKKLSLSNFQSHKKSVLHLHEGVNVIIGLTNAGKTGLLRGFNWVVKNRSEDKSFRSHWGGKADVEICFSDGKEVSRVQDKDNTYYLLDPDNNVDEEYKAFRTDIPEDIVNALNMDSINIQNQFDPPFLLADSPGDVAKTLNKIANLTEIDNAISNIRKLVLANSREITTTEAQTASLQEQLDSFQYIEQMEKHVVEWEELQKELQFTDIREKQLEVTLRLIDQNENELKRLNAFLKAEEGLKAALALVEEERQLTTEISALQTLLTRIETASKEVKEIETFMEAEKELQEGLELIEELNVVQKQGAALQELIKQITVQQIRSDSGTVCIKQLEDHFKRSFPSVCPLCEK